MTQGKGSHEISFARYDVVPANVMNEIIAKFKAENDEDEE